MLAVPGLPAARGRCSLAGPSRRWRRRPGPSGSRPGSRPRCCSSCSCGASSPASRPSRGRAGTALAGYAAGSMAMIYSILFISHQLSAVCIASAWILAVRVVEDGRDVPAAGCWPVFSPARRRWSTTRPRSPGVPVAAYLRVEAVRAARRAGRAALATGGAGARAADRDPALLSRARFGSPLRTGYAASETFAHFHQKGFLGMDRLRWRGVLRARRSRPTTGSCSCCPMLLLALPGFVAPGAAARALGAGASTGAVVASSTSSSSRRCSSGAAAGRSARATSR